MTETAAALFTIAMLFFSLVFLLDWVRFRRQVRPYRRYAFAAACVVIGFEILALLVSPGLVNQISLLGLLLADAWAMLRIAAYTHVGMYYSSLIGHSSFPLLMRRFPPLWEVTSAPTPPVSSEQPTALAIEATPQTADEPLPPVDTTANAQVRQPVPSVRDALTAAGAVVAGAIVLTVVLFGLTTPTYSSIVRSSPSFETAQFGLGQAISPLVLIIVLQVAFAEEIIFRLGIQNFLAKVFKWRDGKYWRAIVLTAALWSLGHVGLIEPQWVKVAQIFPIGVTLGWLYRRFGAESCILAHAGFNVVGMVLTPSLIS